MADKLITNQANLYLDKFSGANLVKNWDSYYVQEWRNLSRNIRKDIIESDKLSFMYIIRDNLLDFDFILEHSYYLKRYNWTLARTQRLTLEQVNLLVAEGVLDKRALEDYSLNPSPNIEVLEEYLPYLELSYLAGNLGVPEYFIEKHLESFLVTPLLQSRQFSDKFLLDNLTKLNICEILRYQNIIDEELKQKFILINELSK